MQIQRADSSNPWPPPGAADPDALVTPEWLVTNGLGGYASGTVAGVITRRYHGVLIAALPAPFGRIVMLSRVAEELRFADGRCYEFGGRERTETHPMRTARGISSSSGSRRASRSGASTWKVS
jgi:glycogen debranching enzyme